MNYYTIKNKNIYAGNGYGRHEEIIYGDGVSEILGAMSKGFFNLLSKKSAQEIGKKVFDEASKVAKDKAVDLATKGATKLTESAFGSIESKVLGKKNKKEEEEKPRPPEKITKAEKRMTRNRMRDIMRAERKRLLAEQKMAGEGTAVNGDNMNGLGLRRLGANMKRGNGLRRLGKK